MAVIDGTSAGDRLVGTDGADLINGFGGNDTLDGGFGADTLNGGDGDDVFSFSAVISTTAALPPASIDGGAGHDTVDASRVAPVSVNTTAAGLQLQVGSQVFALTSVEAILTGAGADSVNIASQTVGLVLSTGDGNDFIQGGLGADTIDAGADNDSLFVATPDIVTGGAGNDFIFVSGQQTAGAFGTIDGGAGTDTPAVNIGVVADLASGALGTAGGLAYIRNFENVQASVSFGFEARVWGDDAANLITADASLLPAGVARFDGRGGNDTLRGAGNNDSLLGGAGDDLLDGGAGNDLLDGGTGFDTVQLSGPGTVDLRLAGPQDTGSGRDTLIGIEGVIGSAERDVVTGNVFANRLDGGSGDDTIDGRAGFDTLVGGGGGDLLRGGGGQDLLQGGDGNDTLGGGVGSDVIDGGAGQDTILLSGVVSDYSVGRSGASCVIRGQGDTDVVTGVEFVLIGAQTLTLAQFEMAAFDPYAYLAANADLYAAFGSDTVAARSHYFATGAGENRNTGDFDALTYIASNRDLIQAFGANAQAGFLHYMGAGRFEGRTTDGFDALEYLARNKDLADAFGLDVAAATRHYIGAGAAEGRATTFDADLYAASNADLTAAFGTDERASLSHFILNGRAEGRATDTFNFQGYASRNPDLAGLSRDALVDHWLAVGQDEGRSTTPVSSAATALDSLRAAETASAPYLSISANEDGWPDPQGPATVASQDWGAV